MHPINILTLNRRISFINVGKYRKEYRKAKQCVTKKSYQLIVVISLSTNNKLPVAQ